MRHAKRALLTAVALSAASCVTSEAQDAVRVPLRVVPAVPFIGWSADYPEAPGFFSAPGNLKLQSLAPASSGCRFRLPSGEEVSLRFDDWQIVNIRRGDRLLPYNATCGEYEKDGKKRHRLGWQPIYRAEGLLIVGDCQRLVAVFDINGDGVLDLRDFGGGSTGNAAFGVDINGDHQIFGQGEYFTRGSVFEVCGKRWEFADLSPAGDWVEFRESKLPKVSVGGPVPAFTLQLDNGGTVNSQQLRGRWYLLDFWASWCVPCLEKVPEVKQLGGQMGERLGIYLINVDDADQVQQAKQLLAKYDMPYPKTWAGLGQIDSVWRMFGAVPDERFAIPLYVLVDPENRVGEVTRRVEDVRAAISKRDQR